MNKAQLIGYVGRDPETRVMQRGDKVCNFSMATSDRWTDKNSGERKEKTEWHNVVIFNENLIKLAEDFISKGSQIFVEGKLRTRDWTDNSGVKHYTTEIVLENYSGLIELLSGGGSQKRSFNPAPAVGTARQQGFEGTDPAFLNAARTPVTNNKNWSDDLDDEIPF